MDLLDSKIVSILETDGRISITELAELLPLSISATRDRLRKLEETAIDRFTIRMNADAIGRPIEALIDVRIGQELSIEYLDDQLAMMPAITNAMHLTGRFDLELRVATRDVAELDDLLTALKGTIGAEETNTRLILRTIEGFPRSPSLEP